MYIFARGVLELLEYIVIVASIQAIAQTVKSTPLIVLHMAGAFGLVMLVAAHVSVLFDGAVRSRFTNKWVNGAIAVATSIALLAVTVAIGEGLRQAIETISGVATHPAAERTFQVHPT